MEDVVIGMILKNSNGDTITFTRSELQQLKSQLDSLFNDNGVVCPVVVHPYEPIVTYW